MRYTTLTIYLFVIVFFSSCGNQTIIDQNEQLKSELVILKDSIVELNDKLSSDRVYNYFKYDTSKGVLGELSYADTLVLFAEFSQCGEFGGFQEWLKVFYDDKFVCQIIEDSTDCSWTGEGSKSYFRITNETVELSADGQKSVFDYLTRLSELTFSAHSAEGNVMNVFKAYIKHEEEFDKLYNYQVHTLEPTLSWEEFQRLKEKIKILAPTKPKAN